VLISRMEGSDFEEERCRTDKESNQLVKFLANDQSLQDAQLSQRDRAVGCVIVLAKSRRLELGDNILRTL